MSIDELASRIASIPGMLADLFARGLPPLDLRLAHRRWSVTAAGIAEGPAHYLVHLLGECARFVPLSVLAIGPPREGDVLVIFSQGLSPNAFIALRSARYYRDTLLLTSAPPSLDGIHVVTLPPETPESGMLIRVLGPAIGRGAALLLANAIAEAEGRAHLDTPKVKVALERAMQRAQGVETGERVVFVMHGDDIAWVRALAWKWMEGLWTPEPPTWDVLQFAHGPLQSIYDSPCTVISLEREEHPSAPLFDRLGKVLVPDRHRWVRLVSTLPGPLAAMEHDAALDVLMLEALKRRPRDLASWPGKGADEPLYALDRPIDP